MHLRSRNLPRPSASSPPGNRSHPMANPAQVPDLEGLHREIHDMAEQMRIMNENNGRLMQLLAAANPPLPAAPPVPDIERSRHSNRSGDRSRNISADQVGRGRRQAPSSSLREKSSSESSKTPTRSRRGRSPHRDDRIRARNKSTSQKFRDLDARLDAINTGAGAPVTVDTLIKQTEPPFTERILRARISSKFKLPAQLGIYEGKTDPMDHLDSYKSLMSLQGCSDEIMCKAFSATLKGPARSWFRKLSPGTIDSFGDLSRLFVANFMSCRNRQKNASHLFTIHQKETESLKDFVKRFNQAILEVEDPSDKVIIMAMMEGLRPGPLFDSLSKNVPETLSTLQSKADKYIAAEELAEAKRRRRGKDDHKRKEPDTRRTDYREETRYKRPDLDPKRSSNRRPRTPPRRPEFILPPLNAPVAQVLSEIKHEEFVKWPGKIKTDPQKRNRNKYCEFHRDHGHNTEDCFQLKEQIADLIKRGYLRKYVANRPPPNSPERRYGDNRPTAGDIQTIHGGFGSGGYSTSSRKRHARSAHRPADEEVYNLSSSFVADQTPITFSNDDLRGVHLPHDDALVVSAVIANFNVQRILIDNGSSADILFISAFERMKIGLDKLRPFHTPLIGFGGNTTHPLGWINLPITLGTEPHQTTVWQDFIVVDCPSPYNAILGRPTLGGIKAITSTYHLKLKFPTPTGIGEIKGDQKVARQCFISAMRVETSSVPPTQ
ncbi:Beta-porphyranase [Actinidia chinensis var. chinensis]|uniref:Beta-porphyranase n=1 Tax=Actinidia chinensis var. chinensis TaxID=1590841 RepID=A0A2R6PBW4_ACTCC|nr:Beta-porphyranase [Actinidia chinensis var. chinensis]